MPQSRQTKGGRKEGARSTHRLFLRHVETLPIYLGLQTFVLDKEAGNLAGKSPQFIANPDEADVAALPMNLIGAILVWLQNSGRSPGGIRAQYRGIKAICSAGNGGI